METLENLLGEKLSIVTGNHDGNEAELKFIKKLADGFGEKSSQDNINNQTKVISDFLQSRPNSIERIKNICVANQLVMTYIIDNYTKENNPTESSVVTYNKNNEQWSNWYNYFYGIILGIEEVRKNERESNYKLQKDELMAIKKEIEETCYLFQANHGDMKGGAYVLQAITLVFIATAAIVNSQGFKLPSQLPLDTSTLPSHTTLSDDVTSAASIIVPVAGGIAAAVAGDLDAATTILQNTLYAEGAVVGFDAIGLKFLGLTNDAQSKNYGKIANEIATQFRRFIQSSKGIVTPSALISETLNNQFNEKIIKVGDKVIAKNTPDFKAIQNSFKFVTSMAETIVFEDYAQTYIAEWYKNSMQSDNPAADGKGPFVSLGIGSGKKIDFAKASEPFKTFVNNIEIKQKALLQQANLDANDITDIRTLMSDFEKLYFNNEITIDKNTMNKIKSLNDGINDGKNGDILDIFKKAKFFDDIKKDWDTFKDNIDGVELNIGMNWFLWGIKYIGTLSLPLLYIYFKATANNNNNNTTWMEWLGSFTGKKQEGGKKIKRKRKTKSKKKQKRKTKKNQKRSNKRRLK